VGEFYDKWDTYNPEDDDAGASCVASAAAPALVAAAQNLTGPGTIGAPGMVLRIPHMPPPPPPAPRTPRIQGPESPARPPSLGVDQAIGAGDARRDPEGDRAAAERGPCARRDARPGCA
jgi:hypothetical protein